MSKFLFFWVFSLQLFLKQCKKYAEKEEEYEFEAGVCVDYKVVFVMLAHHLLLHIFGNKCCARQNNGNVGVCVNVIVFPELLCQYCQNNWEIKSFHINNLMIQI